MTANTAVKLLMIVFLLVLFVGPIVHIHLMDRKRWRQGRGCLACSEPGFHGLCFLCWRTK